MSWSMLLSSATAWSAQRGSSGIRTRQETGTGTFTSTVSRRGSAAAQPASSKARIAALIAASAR